MMALGCCQLEKHDMEFLECSLMSFPLESFQVLFDGGAPVLFCLEHF